MFGRAFLWWIVCSMVFSVLGGALFIHIFSSLVATATREDTPARHRLKGKVPTMAGIFVVVAAIGTFIASGWYSVSELIVVIAILGYACVGLWDDLAKIMRSKGISERQKLCGQVSIAVLATSALVVAGGVSTLFVVPCTSIAYNLGWFFIPWAVLVIVGTSNAVNLTDGLDGLATACLIPNFLFFGCLLYLHGVYGMALLACNFAAALCGFLYFNWYPARVFMGDVGSLSFGAALAFCALLSKTEVLLPIVGAVFVIETLSVIIQVAYYKRYKKRIFKMAPLHHHYELSGYSEKQIVVVAGSISIAIVSVCLGLCSIVL